MKQQCTALLAERQITRFIKNDEISMSKAIGQAALIAVEFFLFKRVDQFNCSVPQFGPRLCENYLVFIRTVNNFCGFVIIKPLGNGIDCKCCGKRPEFLPALFFV
jgi:hypothetical protein